MPAPVSTAYDLQFRAALTDRAARLCRDGAFIEAMESNDGRYIGAEHIFLAIVKDSDSLPAKALRDLGVLDQVVRETRLWIAAIGLTNNEITGDVNGYVVEAEDGDVIVVDEHGSPVSPDDQARRPRPLWHDGDQAVWSFTGSRAEWRRKLRPGALMWYMVGPELANWERLDPENTEAPAESADDAPEP